MRLHPTDPQMLVAAAAGRIPSDLVITNVTLVNLFTGEIYPVNAYVYGGFFSHIQTSQLDQIDPALDVFDAGGQYLLPGFIDSHMHIESSMLTPRNFAKAAIPHGTTTVVTDPHEICNVLGEDGLHYMYDSSEGLPMRQLINIPSCVPSVPGLEHSGAVFGPETIHRFAAKDRVIGLAEIMDFVGVIRCEDRMMQMISTAESCGLYLQGHAPRVRDRNLSAYLCAGPTTCHESPNGDNGEVALEKLRNGMFVDAREGSLSKNIASIYQGICGTHYFDRVTLCTDDREADDLLHHGHINDALRLIVAEGMDAIDAVRCCTLNAAREIGYTNLGAIAPGFAADFVLVPDLEQFVPNAVFFAGKQTASKGKLMVDVEEKHYPQEQQSPMELPPLSLQDFLFLVDSPAKTALVNIMAYENQVDSLTLLEKTHLPVVNGVLDLSGDSSLLYAMVINRYGNGTMGRAVMRNFGMHSGAFASTVAHDSHNVIVVFDSPENGYLVVQELIRIGGGMCCAKDGEILASLPLEVAGLMSLKPAPEFVATAKLLKDALRELGITEKENPMARIVTAALPVIPNIKLSDLGLIDINRKEFIPLIAE